MSLFFLMIFAVWFGIGNFFYNCTLHRKKINTKNIDVISEDVYLDWVRKSRNSFEFLKRESNKEDIYIVSGDSIKKHAYYFPSISHKWVILVHGYLEDAMKLSILGEYYYKMGYHVLLVHLRCHGKSGGVYITMGKKESIDILSFVSYVLQKDPSAEIVLHGVCLGASSILLASSSFPSSVKAIISDSAYTSAYDIFYYQLHTRFGILTYPILFGIGLFAHIHSRISLFDISVLKEVRKNKIPTLFFHSKEDRFIPFIMSKALYEENASFKEFHYVKGEHGISFVQDFSTYTDILSSFLSKYFF